MSKLTLKIILIFSILFVVFVFFKNSVRAAEGMQYRCQSDKIFNAEDSTPPWKPLDGSPKCTTKVGGVNKTGYIWLQFGNSDLSKKTDVKIVTFTFRAAAATATPVPTSAGGATATPVPTAAAGTVTGTLTPTPTPADARASSVNRCPNLGNDTVLDVVPDCKVNTMDGAKILKGIRDHSGQ